MSFRKAERKQAKLRLALCGPSGAGKTYSALSIAQGLAPGGRVALIDSERGSGELYADLLSYDVAPLDPPFTPDRYIQLIHEAEQAGYQVLIIDSLSHAWSGEGGILDMHDKAAAASRSGNSFAAWREVTPAHNQLVDTILGADLHIITTMRTKTAYDMVDDGKGRKKPVKIGMAPIQRDGMEYEFTLVLDLSVEGHIATASKDRTNLFDGTHFLPSGTTGETLLDWLQAGKDPAEASKKLLRKFKTAVTKTESVQDLNDWWRQNSGDISQLTRADSEKLTTHCSLRKVALLADNEEQPKGNGKDPAGIEAITGEATH